MKIKCDVCDKEEAVVFCTCDEAALCNGCDSVVHLANKLASKHLRFPIFTTSPNHSPKCDICKERRAFLFCREDRALFCSECDTCIHQANIHTQNHSRFLLTGIQLSSSVSKSLPTSSCLAADQSSSEMSSVESCINIITHNNSTTTTLHVNTSDSSNNWHPYSTSNNCHHLPAAAGSSSSSTTTTTSINMTTTHEYPMELETLPAGWHFEDFLDPSCFTHQ